LVLERFESDGTVLRPAQREVGFHTDRALLLLQANDDSTSTMM
jgi:hypothetical protein